MLRVPNRVVTKAEAHAKKLTWFFTGKPCRYGHVSTRNVNSSACHACRRKEAQRQEPRVYDQRTYAQRMRDRKEALDLLG